MNTQKHFQKSVKETKLSSTSLSKSKKKHELSEAHSLNNKCKIKLDILKQASNDEWKSSPITSKLREIFNMPLRGKIASLITLATSTYTPAYLLT